MEDRSSSRNTKTKASSETEVTRGPETEEKQPISTGTVPTPSTVSTQNELIAPLLNYILVRVQTDCLHNKEEDHAAAIKTLDNLLTLYPEGIKEQLKDHLLDLHSMEGHQTGLDLTEFLLTKLKEIILQSPLTVNITLYHFLKRDFLFSDNFKSIWSVPKNKPDNYAKKRNEVEEKILGYSGPGTWRMNIQAEAHSRPVYGGVNYADHPFGAAPDYGTVHIVLDPDIIYRSTITPCDSFNVEDLPSWNNDYLDCLATINFLDRIIAQLDAEQLKHLIIGRFLKQRFDVNKIYEMHPIETQILGGVFYEKDALGVYVANEDCFINLTMQHGFKTVFSEQPSIAGNLMLFGYRNHLNIYLVNDSGEKQLFYKAGEPIQSLATAISSVHQFEKMIEVLEKATKKFKYRKIKNELKPIFEIAEHLATYHQLKDSEIDKRLNFLQQLLLPDLTMASGFILDEKFKEKVVTAFEKSIKHLLQEVHFEIERLKLAKTSQNDLELNLTEMKPKKN